MNCKCLNGTNGFLGLAGALLFSISGCAAPAPPADTAIPASPPTSGPAPGNASTDHKHGPGESMALHTDYTKLAFSTIPPTVKAGQLSKWQLEISDLKTGVPVGSFVKMHDKLMHLIVASEDLSFYTHIHPKFEGKGLFTISYALPRAGRYHIYADYVTAAMQHEVARHELTVSGANPLPSKPALVADTLKGMWITKRFRAHDEGEPPSPTAPQYEIALMPMPGVIHAGQEAMLHFQVRDAAGKPLTDLMPYMGAMGHAVILSANGETYLHTHPMTGEAAEMMEGDSKMDHSKMDHSKMGGGGSGGHDMKSMMESLPASTRGGPDVMFHTMFPKPGLYKVWGQFMHRNKVLTADFTLNVLPAASSGKE